ncbi:hypothetical protein ACIOEZ_07050 [Streptomyces sp. NPDC087866]|uniref:hypothetical protein n=1 Tax=unclassified Streptomyces TaxID=2593676 RepID=UPI0022520783|nr:hypothetical protein [Streptomyces sp. NBC_01789]MCX4444877.1 hypothetical protein [Streptomyces sp. NBC_01789]
MNARIAIAALTAAAAALALSGCSNDTQELSYGDTAKKDNLEVSVVRVDTGAPGDLSVLKDASKYQGRTPHYVHYRVTKTEGGSVNGPSFDLTADGELLTRLDIMSAFPEPVVGEDGQLTYEDAPKFDKCLDEHVASKFEKAGAGESYEACSVYLSDAGSSAEPEKVEWVKGGLLRSSDDEAFAVWK